MESFIGGSSSRPIHVFLSFKGDDETRKFTDMLWAALESDDLNTFWDDKKLDPADSIFLPRHFLKAIKQSNILIVVFSKSYASSVWCLEELSEIAARIHEPRYIVIPIFYDVDPSDVENQSNSFENAFAEYEQRFMTNLRKVSSWRLAMKRVAHLSGWDVSYDPCSQVVDDIVRDVKRKMRELMYADADLVGMQRRVSEVEELLDLGSNDEIKVLGICGMGGIGKSTLARVVYDRVSHHFDASHFIPNLGEFYTRDLMVVSQENVLFVFDVADINIELLTSLILKIKYSFLGRGSRIILATRDEGFLKMCGKHHIYRVKLLNKDESLQLFCRKAFKSYFPVRGCNEEVIKRALEYAGGLPLAIIKLGSFLYNTRSSEWSTALVDFKNVFNSMIMKVLVRSFHKLDFSSKEMFLDIACFFCGKDINFVEGLLNSVYNRKANSAKYVLQFLIEKSLMAKIDQKIQMHGLLQEMGREIVRHKSPSKPEEWSRLWDFDDIYAVMQNQKANTIVKAMVLDLEDHSQGKTLRVEALSHMKNLTLLVFCNVKFSGVLSHLSEKLRYISWHQYPFTSLPAGFTPQHLKQLILPNSCITSIWDEENAFPWLTNMDLSGSKDLTNTPNFGLFPSLERLDLEGCVTLSQLHPSVAYHKMIKYLNLKNCTNLVSIPNRLFSRTSLKILNLACCSKLATCLNFPPFDEELGIKPNMKSQI